MSAKHSLALSVGLWLWASGVAAQPYVFQPVAREFVGGLGFLEDALAPATAPDGKVVFAGGLPSSVYPAPMRLFVAGDALLPLTLIDLPSGGFELPKFVHVDSAGRVLFSARRNTSAGAFFGVYKSSVTAGLFGTVYEALACALADPEVPAPSPYYDFGLSPNGTVGFSTILNGKGALSRAVLPAARVTLRAGDGTYFNTREVDVNDAGAVAVEMEYGDPTEGLTRGILIFTAPGQTLSTISTAVEKTNVGFTTELAINASGVVVFSTNSSATLNFYDPPDSAAGALVKTMTLGPGVYRAMPTPFGQPSVVTKIADNSGPYNRFGAVNINASGVIVFEASLDDGTSGIYRGGNAVADKIAQVGDIQGSVLFSWLKMGELNDAGQLSFLSSDYYSSDRQVWRVSNIRALPPVPMPMPRPFRRWPWFRWF